MTAPRVLVAGIGNIFFGDDAFGVEVAQRLAGRPLPDGVKVVDFGIRGVHLAYELLDGYDALVLVDALPMGEPPGTIALIEPELGGEDAADDTADDTAHDTEPSAPLEAHSMSPAVVLAMVAGLGARVGRVLIVGCQPAVVDEGIGLSPVIGAAVDTGVATVIEVLDGLCVVAGRES